MDTRISDWPKKKLLCWRSRSNCLRNGPVRFVGVVLGWFLACAVGALLWKSSLGSLQQEFQLKCENRRQILRSQLENNLNASFVIIGLVASVPELNESTWVSFTKKTLFLRPNVKRLVYLQRVLANERDAFERKWNATITALDKNNETMRRPNDTEYSPIIYETDDVNLLFLDPGFNDLLKSAIYAARDTGLFTLSPPSQLRTALQMGAYLAYYGPGRDSSSFTSNAERMQACQGYVATVLSVMEIFSAILSRFTDDVDMDVVALYNVDATANLNSYFNCSQTALTCELPLFDSANRISEAYTSSVSWEYGTQNFELRCFSKHNLKLLALRSIIAWPLLMSLVVLFSSVIVYLVLKRMQAIEKDVSLMERMNVDLKAAKVAAEAADKAKSSFLATVSHEIRTPMNGVIGMTNLLMGTELTAQQLDYVKVAQASGNALIALINDVLDLSKIEAGKMEIESVSYNLRMEIDNVFSLFDDEVQQKQLDVSMLVHELVPACVIGDPGRFRQAPSHLAGRTREGENVELIVPVVVQEHDLLCGVMQILINLVGNAMKFTKEGSIFVCVRIVDCSQGNRQQCVGGVTTGTTNHRGSAPGDVQLSQVVPNASPTPTSSGSNGVPGSDEFSLGRGVSAPRLSMQPGGAMNTIEAVARWKEWNPRSVSGSCCRPQKNITIIVSVEDTGIGIPLQSQHRLFQPFSQADSSTSREHGGTGIGLSICQKLVKLMDGQLTVTSNAGEGSVFEFTLPLGLPEPTAGSALSCCSKPTWPPVQDEKLNGMRVVLVDSHPVRQEATSSYLRLLGIVIEYTAGVQSTLDLLRRNGRGAVQALFVDLKGLSHASALDLVHLVRKESNLGALPVVAFAVGLSAEAEKELRQSGFSNIIGKPLRYSTLVAGLLEVIGSPSKPPVKKINLNAKMLSGKRLLVVDDNMVNRRVATSMLSRYGATVSSVNSGVEAVAAVKNQKEGEILDLILMDIQMPEMDGWEATREIRKWEVENCEECHEAEKAWCPHHHLPIVALTADVMKATHETCFTSGMDDYITKPLDQKQLHALLERFVGNDLVNAPLATRAAVDNSSSTT